jgi:hypothetical protein
MAKCGQQPTPNPDAFEITRVSTYLQMWPDAGRPVLLASMQYGMCTACCTQVAVGP